MELAPRASAKFPLVLERGRWVFDADEKSRREAEAFFLCNPQNPGGTVFRREELEAIADATGDCSSSRTRSTATSILDAGLRHVPIASLSPEVSRRTVTLMSANKSFNIPAAGCGWAIIEDARCAGLLRRGGAHVLARPRCSASEATLAALRDGDDWLAAQLDYLRGNRDLVGAIPNLPMAHVEATYLAWIDCSPLGIESAYEFFLQSGVAVSPGRSSARPAHFVRLNFGTQAPPGAARPARRGARPGCAPR